MTTPEIIVVTILSLSLTANIFYVVFNKPLGKYTYRWDLFRWISAFQLFSVKPRNYRLFYRNELGQGKLSEWTEVPITAGPRWFHPFVFPEKLVPDNVYSFVDDLVRFFEDERDPDLISNTFQSKTISRYVCSLPDTESLEIRQLRINETEGHVASKSGTEPVKSEFIIECISN